MLIYGYAAKARPNAPPNGFFCKIEGKCLAGGTNLCYNRVCTINRMPGPPESRQSGDKEVKTMKEKIHPNYGKAVVRCVCGETFETGSVKKEMRVDICSKCHPFYTGKQKLIDSGGRVDRFKKRYGM